MGKVWRLELLGGLRARRGEQTVNRFGSGSGRLLLGYLALPVGRAHPRDALAELFWPESAPEKRRTNLRQALTGLRRALEPPGIPEGTVIVADRQSVRLNPEAVTTDVAEFCDACRAAAPRAGEPAAARVERLERAVSLYGGELLPGVTEAWAFAERWALAQTYEEAVQTLVSLLEQAQSWERAREWARQVVAADPLDVTSHATVIRLLVLQGKREAAREYYEAFCQESRQKLGAAPELSFTDLLADAERSRGAIPIQLEMPETGRTAVPALSRAGASGARPVEPTGLLPLPLTQFFGRETELEELAEELARRRLITLLGPGGIGKSRLALEVARQWRAAPGGGAVWVVALQAVSDPGLLAGHVLASLGLQRSPEVDPLLAILPVLARQPTLLLLDNMEHLLPAGAEFARQLLERVPALTLLITSRQPLELLGEQEFWLAPLPVPEEAPPATPGSPSGSAPDLAKLSECPSVALFVDRARLVRSQFGLTAVVAETVGSICRQLEGIPLALELAGAAMRTKTLAEIHAGLKQRLDSFHGGRRFPELRHQTLRAAFDWSYELLPPGLQQLFRCLSVFRGGWSIDAAHTVCQRPDAPEALERLRERSLILMDQGAGETRYRMLETLREYGVEVLSSKERGLIAQHHAEFFLHLAEQAEPHLFGAEQEEWLARLDPEHDNLRAALRWFVQSHQIQEAMRLAAALWEFWGARGHTAEGRQWLTRLLALPGAERRTAARARALHAAGWAAGDHGDEPASQRLFAESLAIERVLGDTLRLGRALTTAGAFEEGLRLGREAGDLWGIGYALRLLAFRALAQGDLPEARIRFEESLAVQRSLGNRRKIAIALTGLGTVAWNQNDYPAARSLFEESLAIHRSVGNRTGMLTALNHLCFLTCDQGDYASARTFVQEGIQIAVALGKPIHADLFILGDIALLEGELEEARSIYQQCMTDLQGTAIHFMRAKVLRGMGHVARYEGKVELARSLFEECVCIFRERGNQYEVAHSLQGLGAALRDQGELQGARQLLHDSLIFCLQAGRKDWVAAALEILSGVAEREAQPEEAARLLGAAAGLRREVGTPVPPVARPEIEGRLQRLSTALGHDRLQTTLRSGQALPLQQLVEMCACPGAPARGPGAPGVSW